MAQPGSSRDRKQSTLGSHLGVVALGLPHPLHVLTAGVVPACLLSWVPGLAWELPVTSARDCDITEWRCREEAGGLQQGSSQGPSKMGDPKKNRAGACWGLARRGVSGGSPASCQPAPWVSTLYRLLSLSLSRLAQRFPWAWAHPWGQPGLWALWVRPRRNLFRPGRPACLPSKHSIFSWFQPGPGLVAFPLLWGPRSLHKLRCA